MLVVNLLPECVHDVFDIMPCDWCGNAAINARRKKGLSDKEPAVKSTQCSARQGGSHQHEWWCILEKGHKGEHSP